MSHWIEFIDLLIASIEFTIMHIFSLIFVIPAYSMLPVIGFFLLNNMQNSCLPNQKRLNYFFQPLHAMFWNESYDLKFLGLQIKTFMKYFSSSKFIAFFHTFQIYCIFSHVSNDSRRKIMEKKFQENCLDIFFLDFFLQILLR